MLRLLQRSFADIGIALISIFEQDLANIRLGFG